MNVLADIRRKQAARRHRRAFDRAVIGAAQWLGLCALALASIPAVVLLGLAMAESARLMN